MTARLCLFFYATNIVIIPIIGCVSVSLLMLEHLYALNQTLLHDIPSAFVIAIILCGVDKCVTTCFELGKKNVQMLRGLTTSVFLDET